MTVGRVPSQMECELSQDETINYITNTLLSCTRRVSTIKSSVQLARICRLGLAASAPHTACYRRGHSLCAAATSTNAAATSRSAAGRHLRATTGQLIVCSSFPHGLDECTVVLFVMTLW